MFSACETVLVAGSLLFSIAYVYSLVSEVCGSSKCDVIKLCVSESPNEDGLLALTLKLDEFIVFCGMALSLSAG